MANFSESYSNTEEVEEGMSEDGLLSGFGGVILGGLAGYALSNWNRGGINGGTVGGQYFSQADVDNIVATKDAQYAQLNATQQGDFNTINRIDVLGTNLAQGLASLGYENARLSNSNQVQTMTSSNQVQSAVADASAKADLCCCRTQGMISNIVPEMKNFYLTDEVAKLRGEIGQQQVATGFEKVNTSLGIISTELQQVLAKLYATT